MTRTINGLADAPRESSEPATATPSEGEFSVFQEFDDGTQERVRSFVDAKTAVLAAKHYTTSVGAQVGIVRRVIITDGGDFTAFEWKYGEGVTFPPHDGTKFVAPEDQA